jgi:hypothetical protein
MSGLLITNYSSGIKTLAAVTSTQGNKQLMPAGQTAVTANTVFISRRNTQQQPAAATIQTWTD